MPKHWRPARAATSRRSARHTSKARGRERGTRARFIDKMPLNFFYAALIRRCLPNAKIVCLRRNPLDTCLSNYRQLFATSFSYYNYSYELLDTGRYYIAFHALDEAVARVARGELPRGPLRGRRRAHRARSASARRFLRIAVGRAVPRVPGQRRAGRDGELGASPSADLPLRARAMAALRARARPRCASCSPPPGCSDGLLNCPRFAGGPTRVHPG